MGVLSLSSDRAANLWINVIGYLAILIAALTFIVSILSDRS